MREVVAKADAAVAEIAARQHGVVTATQLNSAGFDKSGVDRRLRAGRLHRIYRGVYAVGHPGLSSHGRWMAAVLACGTGAVLSHRAAAELWQLLPAGEGVIDVTVPTQGGRLKRPDLRIHRSRLLRGSTTIRDRIAVTTPARTLADVERAVPPSLHRRAVRQAEFLGLPLGGLETDHTRSDLERAFLRLCRRHRLPGPEVNVRIGRFTVDFLWARQRLAVETDGWNAHRGRRAFLDDRERELELRSRGYRVLRISDRQIETQATAVAADLRRALARP